MNTKTLNLNDGPPCLQTLFNSNQVNNRHAYLFMFAIYCKKKYGNKF